MSSPALLDSNVIIAAFLEGHVHHDASFSLFDKWRGRKPAVAAHSLAEAYNTLTRPGADPRFIRTPDETIALLDNLRPLIELLGLTPSQVFEGIRKYANQGGIGPRLYDKLIGEVAAAHGISMVITWNGKHMRGLFPAMKIVDPAEFNSASG